MHELARCRVLASGGPIDGYVTLYADGVLRLVLEGAPVVCTVGDVVIVTVLDPVRGECTYRGLVTGGLGADLDVAVTETLDRRQRRSAARADYQVPCLAVLEGEDGPSTVAVTVIDVSATGLRVASRRRLDPETELTVRLPAAGEVLDLRVRVVRSEEGAHSWWRHGCEIVGPDARTKERLYRLVARLQREEARRAAETRE